MGCRHCRGWRSTDFLVLIYARCAFDAGVAPGLAGGPRSFHGAVILLAGCRPERLRDLGEAIVLGGLRPRLLRGSLEEVLDRPHDCSSEEPFFASPAWATLQGIAFSLCEDAGALGQSARLGPAEVPRRMQNAKCIQGDSLKEPAAWPSALATASGANCGSYVR